MAREQPATVRASQPPASGRIPALIIAQEAAIFACRAHLPGWQGRIPAPISSLRSASVSARITKQASISRSILHHSALTCVSILRGGQGDARYLRAVPPLGQVFPMRRLCRQAARIDGLRLASDLSDRSMPVIDFWYIQARRPGAAKGGHLLQRALWPDHSSLFPGCPHR